jgi:heat shock protein HslJ
MSEPIEQLLRATFREDAADVSAAGDLAARARDRLRKQRRRRWQVAGSGLALVAVVGGIGIADAVRSDRAAPHRPPTASPTAAEPELVGTEWQLVEFTRTGRTTPVPADYDWVLRFDRNGTYSGQACNYIHGHARLDGRHLALDGGPETDMGCSEIGGDIQAAFVDLIAAEPQVEWNIDQQRLVLRRPGGDALVYQVRDSIYPTPAQVIIAGEHDGRQYRVAVTGSGDQSRLYLEVRPARWAQWAGSGMLATLIRPWSGARTLLFHRVGDATLVAGAVPGDAVRVRHTSAAHGAHSELPLYLVQGLDWKVFAGLVPTHTDNSAITAYDDHGRIVASWSTPGWERNR